MASVSRTAIRRRAETIFGSRADARDWLNSPALALEQRRPADLLESEHGRKVLWNLLIQLEYGVFV